MCHQAKLLLKTMSLPRQVQGPFNSKSIRRGDSPKLLWERQSTALMHTPDHLSSPFFPNAKGFQSQLQHSKHPRFPFAAGSLCIASFRHRFPGRAGKASPRTRAGLQPTLMMLLRRGRPPGLLSLGTGPAGLGVRASATPRGPLAGLARASSPDTPRLQSPLETPPLS